MKKIYLSLILIVFFAGQSTAQTYADDVAQIVFDNCTSCHHTGGIAPFPLMTYAEVSSMASLIQPAVNNRVMPPWPPNSNYSQLAHDRSLTQAEITTINNWINAGTPQGNPANTPPTPTYNVGSVLGPGDMSVKMPDYISKATFSNDDYVCLSIPLTGLATSRTIQAIEVVPGNPEIVHHALIYIDPSGSYSTDTSSHSCGGPSGQNVPLIAGYAPGSIPAQFPNTTTLKMGIDVAPGSNIVLAMHYPAGSQGMLDSTRVNLHFYPQGTSGVRQVSANPVLYNYSFYIGANTVDSVENYFPSPTTPIPANYTLFSVFPHTHLLGQSFIVYAVNHFPPYDQIPLIHIPQWDFEWQGFYVFKYLQKIPAGYKLYGKAVYDNTTNNPFNPNSPPLGMGFGLNTTDEMFLVYFQYMPYQTGDELINVDSLLQLQVPTGSKAPLAVNDGGLFLTSFPNPTSGLTTIQYFSDELAEVSLGIYDVQGKLVKQLIAGEQMVGEQRTTWDGNDAAGNIVPPGVYISQLKVGDKMVTNKILRSSKP